MSENKESRMSNKAHLVTIKIVGRRFLSLLEKELLASAIKLGHEIVIEANTEKVQSFEHEIYITVISNLKDDLSNCPLVYHPDRHLMAFTSSGVENG